MQELGVDEPDIVKTDGSTLFTVSGTRIENPDFAALARSYGAFGEWVETTEAFGPALDRALAAMRDDGVPALLALRADPKIITAGMVLED